MWEPSLFETWDWPGWDDDWGDCSEEDILEAAWEGHMWAIDGSDHDGQLRSGAPLFYEATGGYGEVGIRALPGQTYRQWLEPAGLAHYLDDLDVERIWVSMCDADSPNYDGRTCFDMYPDNWSGWLTELSKLGNWMRRMRDQRGVEIPARLWKLHLRLIELLGRMAVLHAAVVSGVVKPEFPNLGRHNQQDTPIPFAAVC